jgi:hypothetical protein
VRVSDEVPSYVSVGYQNHPVSMRDGRAVSCLATWSTYQMREPLYQLGAYQSCGPANATRCLNALTRPALPPSRSDQPAGRRRLPLLKLLCAHASVSRAVDVTTPDTKLPTGAPQTDVFIHSVMVSNDTDNTMTSNFAAGERARAKRRQSAACRAQTRTLVAGFRPPTGR